MGLKIISASQFAIRLKCTIHRSGKLGFTEATARHLEFNDNSAVKFAEDDENSDILYLINKTEMDDDAFKVCKAGRYFYVNTKLMFDNMGIDYKNKTVMFDMIRMKEIEGEVYKLVKRGSKNHSKDEVI